MKDRTGIIDAKDVNVSLSGRVGTFPIDVSFAAPGSGVTALFGRSGSGKTTVLRAIAGLVRLSGTVRIGDETWQNGSAFRPPHRRATGYVFQEANLFPHLSVEKNLVFGARRTDQGIDRTRFSEIVDLLRLSDLLQRSPTKLSGGERQRVAIGRAILSSPKLLLMDEPLSALDRTTKDEVLPYLERLHDALSIPILYVSHDIREVERLADRIVVLETGSVRAVGPINETLTDADLGFFRDSYSAAVLPAQVTLPDAGDGLAELDLGGQRVFVDAAGVGEPGARRRLRIAASDVSLSREAPHASTILNILQVRIQRIDPTASPANVAVVVSLVGEPHLTFAARVTHRSTQRLDLKAGDQVYAQVKSVSLATARGIGG